MADFQLRENEKLIGSGMMAYKHKKSLTSEPTRGTIYVTNQRVCYYESWSGYEYMNLPLSEISGYSVKSMLVLFTFVHIHDRNNKSYSFSGFPAKNLQKWLEQVGVKKLS